MQATSNRHLSNGLTRAHPAIFDWAILIFDWGQIITLNHHYHYLHHQTPSRPVQTRFTTIAVPTLHTTARKGKSGDDDALFIRLTEPDKHALFIRLIALHIATGKGYGGPFSEGLVSRLSYTQSKHIIFFFFFSLNNVVNVNDDIVQRYFFIFIYFGQHQQQPQPQPQPQPQALLVIVILPKARNNSDLCSYSLP